MIHRPKSDLLRLALLENRRNIYFAALFSALVNILYIAPTLYMIQIYDRVVTSKSVVTLIFISAILAIALITLLVLDFSRNRILIKIGLSIDHALSKPMINKSIKFDKSSENQIFISGLDTIRNFFSSQASVAIFDLPWIPIYVLICFLLHPFIGLISIVGLLTLPLLSYLSERRLRGTISQARSETDKTYRSLFSMLAAGETIQALGMANALSERQYELRNSSLLEQGRAGLSGSLYISLGRFFRQLLQSAALGAGAWLAIGNSISLGSIFAASFLISKALQPAEQVIASAKVIAAAMDRYQAIDEALKDLAIQPRASLLPPPVGHLDVKNLAVQIDGQSSYALSDVGFKVEPADVVAVLGASGSGKTSLLKAIAGIMDHGEGTIRFDQTALEDWDPGQRTDFIGYHPQGSDLFEGTIAENISRFVIKTGENSEDVDRKVVAAAVDAGAWEMIKSLPGGLNYRLGLGGVGLSFGQSQRIALARALYNQPRYLLLDEPNSHLDVPGDAALAAMLAKQKANGTTILIATHKLDVLHAVDKLLVLRMGKVDLYGPRTSVLKELARRQKARGGEDEGG